MKPTKPVVAAVIAATLLAAFAGYRVMSTTPMSGMSADAAPVYHCPMHPSYTSRRPGSCPICGMDLVLSEATPSPTETPASAASAPLRATITLPPERLQLLGVRSEPVETASLVRTVRTVGRVAVDETRIHHVHSKFEGYVEKLYVDAVGARVRRGQPLLAIYSPELVATQQEYLLAFRAQARLAEGGVPSAARGGLDLLEAARQRLLLWDIRAEDIARLEEEGRAARTLDLHADAVGFVVEKTAFPGVRVMPEDSLYTIADLSRVWVLADVYESDLASIRRGIRGGIEAGAFPGRRWSGVVTFVSPTLDPRTRTIAVRIEVENARGLLKPEMFTDVFLSVGSGRGVVAPDGAVIHAGDRLLLFVDHGSGRFEPREVVVGPKVDGGRVHIRSGVRAGERVVTAAQFLLDSESSLKAALSGFAAAAQGSPSASPATSGHAGHR